MYEGKTMVDVQQKVELINLCDILQIDLPLHPMAFTPQSTIENRFNISDMTGTS